MPPGEERCSTCFRRPPGVSSTLSTKLEEARASPILRRGAAALKRPDSMEPSSTSGTIIGCGVAVANLAAATSCVTCAASITTTGAHLTAERMAHVMPA